MQQDELKQMIDGFLQSGPFAVVGASANRAKYGNKVLRAYLQNDLEVYAVHPRENEVEGQPCYADLKSLPKPVRGVSIITPPQLTERIVEEIPGAGATHVWMQPGAESEAAVRRAEELGLTVFAGGPCVLIALGYRD